MTSFAYWQNEATSVGLVMCMICFEMKNIEFMHKDNEGDVWDICEDCHVNEQNVMLRRGLL